MYEPATLLPRLHFDAGLAELPVRDTSDTGAPEYLRRARVTDRTANGVRLDGETASGASTSIELSVLAPGIARVLLTRPEVKDQHVRLAKPDAGNLGSVTVEAQSGEVSLESALIHVRAQLDPFRLTFHTPDGGLLLGQEIDEHDVRDCMATLPFGYSDVDGLHVAFHESFTAEPDEHFYGFGEKFSDFDKRGQRLRIWMADSYGVHCERAYKNVPFFVSTRGYGILVDGTSAIEFDMAATHHSATSIIVPDSALDYYVIAGPELKDVVARYSDLVGHPILPPKWAFGLWMSSGFKEDSADDVIARARALRDRDVPCDVIHLDCYWQKHGSWSDLQWDLDLFPDPKALLDELHERGFRVCAWMNPYIGIESPLFDQAVEKGYFLKHSDGSDAVYQIWGSHHPKVGIIDITKPSAVHWLRGLLRDVLEAGVDVMKSDFGEAVPRDTIADNGMTGDQLHNLYPLIYNDIVAEITREVTAGPGLVWGRSTYTGGQRHAAQWAGDPNCTFPALASTLRGGLSMAMCGHAFWSHDIGGFHRTPSPELYVRWAQFGLFSPLSRAHGMSSRLPWDFGEEAERIFREYTKHRYRLSPYIYSYATIAHQTGLPVMRPMVLEFPDDPCTHTLDLQYMFGAELLVAPIYNAEGRRPVYLPKGKWIDYWTLEVSEGPATVFVEAPLDRLPLYVRGDALIPTIQPGPTLGDGPFERVTVDSYVFSEAAFALHDVDGSTTVRAERRNGGIDLHLQGARTSLDFRFLPLGGLESVVSVTVNGAAVQRIESGAPSNGSAWFVESDGVMVVSLAL